MMKLGSIFYELTADTMGLSKGVDKANKEVGRLDNGSRQAEGGFTSLGRVAEFAFGNLISNAIGTATSALGNFLNEQKSSAAEFESTRMAFDGLLGSAEVAGSVMNDIVKEAAATPFEIPELASSGKMLAAFGVEADKIVPSIRMVGDVAAGLNVPIEDMAYLVGTIKTQGKAMTADLNQFANRGVPIWKELEKITGKNGEALRDFVQDGNVGFDMVEQAFSNMTGEGGAFFNMMNRQSNTLNGLTSTLQDTFGALGRRILGVTDTGEVIEGQFFDRIKTGTKSMIDFLGSDAGIAIANAIGSTVGIAFDTIAKAQQKALDIGKSLYEVFRLLITGDFRGGIFGMNEDDPFINGLFVAREILIKIGTALALLADAAKFIVTGEGLFSPEKVTELVDSLGLTDQQIDNIYSTVWKLRDGFLAFKDIVQNAFNDVSQNALPFLLENFQKLASWFMTEAMPPILEFVNFGWQLLIDAFTYFMTNVWPGIMFAFNLLKDLFLNVVIPVVVDAILRFLWPALKDIWAAMMDLWTVLFELWKLIAPVIVPVLGILAAIIIGVLIGAFWLLAAVIRVIAAGFRIFAEILLWLFTTIKSSVTNIIGGIINIAQGWIKVFRGIFTGDIRMIGEGFKQIFNGLMQYLRGLDFFGIGRSIIQGLINGVWNMASNLTGTLRNVVGGAIDSTKRILGIRSPSTVFLEIGEDTGQGMINGLTKKIREINSTSSELGDATIRGAIDATNSASQSDISNVSNQIQNNRQNIFKFEVPAGSFVSDKNIRDFARRTSNIFDEEGVEINPQFA